MFSFFANKLTEYTNHYIDWSRSAELLQSGRPGYNKEELLRQGILVLSTAMSAFLGAYFNDEEKTQCSNLTLSIAAGVLGCVVSHLIVIAPLIKKRYAMSKDCDQLAKTIELQLKNNQPAMSQQDRDTIHSMIKWISEKSLSDNQHARASQTWGTRRSLLSNLSKHLAESNVDVRLVKENLELSLEAREHKKFSL
jgi:hypothetical protein